MKNLTKYLSILLVTLLVALPARGQDPFTNKAPQGTVMAKIDTVAVRLLIPNDGSYGKALGAGLELVENILTEAFRHLGKRYRIGGKGPNHFDCSGFTGYVFRRHNFEIGASSRDQYARNHPVDRGNMQRGDLVFFTSAHSGKHVGHVGIVVEVDPTSNTFSFIHASTRNGVIVSRSTDGYYARRFVGVRRVVR